MKTVFGAVIATALVLIQPLWAEDAECGGTILRGGCIDTSGNRLRTEKEISSREARWYASVGLKQAKSYLTESKSVREKNPGRAATLRLFASALLEVTIRTCPSTPEAKEAAELLIKDFPTAPEAKKAAELLKRLDKKP